VPEVGSDLPQLRTITRRERVISAQGWLERVRNWGRSLPTHGTEHRYCIYSDPRDREPGFKLNLYSSNQRYSNPAMAAPITGATQNIHSWAIAHPPTIKAGPVLRAGLTEVLVTGMATR